MNNEQGKDPNKRISKTVKVERFLVDWVLSTNLSFSTYVRVFLHKRYEDAHKPGRAEKENISDIP